MKKIFFSLALACIIISACKKDNKPTPQSTNGKKYQVAFNVSGFTQQYQNIKTNALLNDSLIYPNYGRYPLSRGVSVAVCNAAGYQVAYRYVNTSTGNVSLELNEGQYTAYFFSYLNDDTRGFNPYNDPRQTEDAVYGEIIADGPNVGTFFYGGYSMQPFTRESFFKKVDFTVSTTSTTPITVQLTSIVAKVIVEVKDAIPDNIDVISIGMDSLSEEFIFKGSTTREKTGSSCGWKITNTLYSQKGRKFVSYFLVEPNTIRDVKIGYRLKGTNDSKVKTIQNVPLSPNSITVLSGKLFNNLGLKVDTTWNANVINQSF